VGSGIAGLGAAWALSRHHEVTLFEAEDRLGGHANTVEVTLNGQRIAVDTGFIVYNLRTYPHLIRLFEQLGVPTEASSMSFGVSLGDGRVEYAGSPRGLFAQKRNLLRPGHWSMIRDVLRFYRNAPKLLQLPPTAPEAAQTLGDYLQRHGYGRSFVYDHLLPMAAAIWSCPVERMLAFPIRSFVRFCDNHGLLLLRGRPQWRTVTGGSREYVKRVADGISGPIRLATPVRALTRDPAGVKVTTDAGAERFDQVVVATHGDRALQLLGRDADARERAVLGAFGYEPNRAVLHGDPRLMPARRAVWSSWNYMGDGAHAPDAKVSVSYWMNSLQNLTGPDLFVSLNPLQEPDPARCFAEFTYDHPVFDTAALDAQACLPDIQGVRRTWFCGSYCGYGFHEDGLESGFAVAAALGAPAPWWNEVTPASPAAEVAAQPAGAPADAVAGVAAE
jgi:hypothetical protein